MPVETREQVTQSDVQVFTEREYVDMPRACRILDASWTMVNRMAASGLLVLVDFRKRAHKRVSYQSIGQLRYRDEEILPFPSRDTIPAIEAAPMLGYLAKWSVWKLCEEGRFEAYRLHPCSAWRISRSSLQAYLSEIKKGIHGGPAAYNFVLRTDANSAHEREEVEHINQETKAKAAIIGGFNG